MQIILTQCFKIIAAVMVFSLVVSGPAMAGTHHYIGASGKPADPPDGWQSSVPLIAKADAAAGKAKAQICAVCHTFGNGGGPKIGPNLYNILNRPRASVAGFSYSDAMLSHKGTLWSYDELDSYLFEPSAQVPGTKMSFPGFKDAQDRANVIAFLRTLSDHPAPLPR
jgi:cytochrome c